MTNGNEKDRKILPVIAVSASYEESLEGLFGVEECVRYYPPNMTPPSSPDEVFRMDSAFQPEREIDLFVDVPFCGTICGFCPFNVYRYDEVEADSYMKALEKEIREIKLRHDFSRIKARTVWIGGGTPSVLKADVIERLIETLYENFDLSSLTEFTFEIKPTPSDLTDEKLEILRRHRVSRISMGVQSTDKDQLKILGRRHSAADAYDVIKIVKDAGFVLNIDMMYRLPGQNLSEVERDLDEVRFLGIEHMSWFPYVAHDGTNLATRIDHGRVDRPGGRDDYFSMFKSVLELMADAGYEQYTPYHFALTERCVYHTDRWQMPQLETLGIGPGAFSFFNGNIYANEHNPEKYKHVVDSNLPPVMIAKKLTETEMMTRLVVLGSKFFSLDMKKFRELSGVEMTDFYEKELDLLINTGLIEIRDNRIECTLKGRAFNNDIATVFGTDIARRTRHPQAIYYM